MSQNRPSLLRLKGNLLCLLAQVLWAEQVDLVRSGLHYACHIIRFSPKPQMPRKPAG